MKQHDKGAHKRISTDANKALVARMTTVQATMTVRVSRCPNCGLDTYRASIGCEPCNLSAIGRDPW